MQNSLFHNRITSRTTLFVILLSLFFISFSIPIDGHAATKATVPVYTYTRLFYYQGGAQARKSFLAHPTSIDIFAPQAYGLDDSGLLTGSVDPILLAFAKQHQIKVMPLVTNNGFNQGASEAILDDPAKQTASINALIQEAKQESYWGWQVDFEQMDASYKDKFSAFIQKAYSALKQNNLVLSVAVVSKISDNPNDYPNNLWQKLIGVYDYNAIASSTDFVSVMSYDDPNSTGPVVEYSWLQSVLAYSLAHIPKEKISLGIPLYYWQWSDASGKRIGIGGNTGIQNVLSKHKVALHYSSVQQAPYLTYWSRKQSFTIWYENAKSIAQKIALIKKNGLFGFSGWALGLEQANVYSAMTE